MLYRVHLKAIYKLTGEAVSGKFIVEADDDLQAMERLQEDYDCYGLTIEDLQARRLGRRAEQVDGVELPLRTGGK